MSTSVLIYRTEEACQSHRVCVTSEGIHAKVSPTLSENNRSINIRCYHPRHQRAASVPIIKTVYAKINMHARASHRHSERMNTDPLTWICASNRGNVKNACQSAGVVCALKHLAPSLPVPRRWAPLFCIIAVISETQSRSLWSPTVTELAFVRFHHWEDTKYYFGHWRLFIGGLVTFLPPWPDHLTPMI